MRLVMTMLVRDEVDVVRENLDFHFSQGVDFAIVMDHRSRDGTRAVLDEYERAARIRVLNAVGPYDQVAWLNKLVWAAVHEEGADWVLPNDADEFWVPRERTLRELVMAVPPDVGAIVCPRVYFAPAPEDGRPWWERMTLRQRVPVAKTGLALNAKIIHRAHDRLGLSKGNHQRREPVVGRTVRSDAVEVQHFQMRTYAQFERGVVLRGMTLREVTDRKHRVTLSRRREYRIWREGALPDYYRRYLRTEPDDQYAPDTRLRDHLRRVHGSNSPPVPGGRGHPKAAAIPVGPRLGAVPVRVRIGAVRAIRRAPMPPAPIIVGVPQSGTALLRQMLDSHPELAMVATGFLPELIRRWRRSEGAGARRSEMLAEAIELIAAHRCFGALEVSRDRLVVHLGTLRRPTLGDVARAVHVLGAESEGKPRWGDVSPTYVARIKVLGAALPEARFVHVIRDGRDVALSLRSAGSGPGDAEKAMRLWRRRIRRARRQAAKLPPHHYTEVGYEALMHDPEVVLRRLAGFLDLPYDPLMVRCLEDKRLTGEASMTDQGVHRWRTEMDAAELRTAEGVGGDLLVQLGYDVGS